MVDVAYNCSDRTGTVPKCRVGTYTVYLYMRWIPEFFTDELGPIKLRGYELGPESKTNV